MEQVSGWAEQGGSVVTIPGTQGSGVQRFQQSFRGATVTVRDSSNNLATIYSDDLASPTAKANPFTASSTTGSWNFYTTTGTYTLTFSGGSITAPFSITVNVGLGNAGGIPSYAYASLPTSKTQNVGNLARVTDNQRGVWMDMGTQWFPLNYKVVNVMEFGAKGNGTTDDTTAILAAIAAIPAAGIAWPPDPAVGQTSGGCVYFPPGIYRITAPIINYTTNQAGVDYYWNLWLRGSGPNSVIYNNSAGSTTIRTRPTNGDIVGIKISDLTFTSDLNATNTTSVLDLDNTRQLTILDTTFQQHLGQAIKFVDGFAFFMSRCVFSEIGTAATPHATIDLLNSFVIAFHDCLINNCSTEWNVAIESGGSLTIESCNMPSAANGVIIGGNRGAVNQPVVGVTIRDSSFEFNGASDIGVQVGFAAATNQATGVNVLIDGNQFQATDNPASSVGVKVIRTTATYINNNVINGNSGAGAYAIHLAGGVGSSMASSVQIGRNRWTGSAPGVYLQNDASGNPFANPSFYTETDYIQGSTQFSSGAVILLPGGATVGAPNIAHASNTDTGIYFPSTTSIATSINATQVHVFNDDNFNIISAGNTGYYSIGDRYTPRLGPNTPEGALAAPVGSLFLRSNGGGNTTLYVKESGVGNTGWVAK